MNRSIQQNKLYHEYTGQLHKLKTLSVWDGRYQQNGYQNPFRLRPTAFSYDTFRDIMKALDMEYRRDSKGIPVSSTKLSVDEMSSHILFLQCLIDQ